MQFFFRGVCAQRTDFFSPGSDFAARANYILLRSYRINSLTQSFFNSCILIYMDNYNNRISFADSFQILYELNNSGSLVPLFGLVICDVRGPYATGFNNMFQSLISLPLFGKFSYFVTMCSRSI